MASEQYEEWEGCPRITNHEQQVCKAGREMMGAAKPAETDCQKRAGFYGDNHFFLSWIEASSQQQSPNSNKKMTTPPCHAHTHTITNTRFYFTGWRRHWRWDQSQTGVARTPNLTLSQSQQTNSQWHESRIIIAIIMGFLSWFVQAVLYVGGRIKLIW